jgi:hypothetical protein
MCRSLSIIILSIIVLLPRNVLNNRIDASKGISLLENNRDSPTVQEDIVQLIPLPAPLPFPVPVTVEVPIGRKRSGSVIEEGVVGGSELKRALRGSIAVMKGAFLSIENSNIAS